MFLWILQYGRNLLRIMLLLPGDPATCSLTDWRPLLTDFEMKNFDGYMKRWPGVFFHVQGHQWTSIYIYTQSQAIPNWGLLLGIALYFVSHIERCWFSFEHVFNSLFIYIYPSLSLYLSQFWANPICSSWWAAPATKFGRHDKLEGEKKPPPVFAVSQNFETHPTAVGGSDFSLPCMTKSGTRRLGYIYIYI